MSTQGYFLNDTWHPFRCKIKTFSVEETLTCLKGTHIYMFGDSTIRQFKEYFQSTFEGFKDISEKRRFPLSPKHLYNSVYNITVKYRSHGLPLKTPCQPMTEIHYVFNELDKLQGGPDVVILISLWAHFGKTTLYLYEKRIEAILDSVQRLLERFPETTVIFKGANTRNNDDSFWAICSSDWVAYRFEKKVAKYTFKKEFEHWVLRRLGSNYCPLFC
ncbi:NXPE family member 3 [Holothuria leucospilota]|uniref:NXPE family member 3 n=1 Tax=Holothuria leucospilota TaxID=206669 RepID=A0A9Q1H899_HOLLE|nr:NXPE family member 3 [Holothuria leucospilota]